MKNALVTERGSLSLEAAITLPVFFFFVLLCYHMLASIIILERYDQAVYQAIDQASTSERLLVTEDYHVEELKVRLLAAHTALPKEALLTTFEMDFDETSQRGEVSFTYRYRLPFLGRWIKREWNYPVYHAGSGDSLPHEEGEMAITRTGIRFHRPGCYHVRLSDISIGEKSARLKAYTPCQQCIGGD